MEHRCSSDGVTSVSVRLYRTTQCCRTFTLALARLSCLLAYRKGDIFIFPRKLLKQTWSQFLFVVKATILNGKNQTFCL